MHYNIYNKELSKNEIKQKKYRSFVGGMWKEIGNLQLDFLIAQGLKKNDMVLDLGCGALRGGIRIIEFLEEGHYFGLDTNQSLINAGLFEIKENKLEDKKPKLKLSNNFGVKAFGQKFDLILSVSLFTHLPLVQIDECVRKACDSLKLHGRYFSSFFEADPPRFKNQVMHPPSKVTTYPDRDPFHQTFESFEEIAEQTGLQVDYIGDWMHPRNQKMVCFTKIK